MSDFHVPRPRRLAASAELLSVVIPVYDEEDVLPLLGARLRPVLDELVAQGAVHHYELIFVDDGSRDDTLAVAAALAEDWPEVCLVELRRNSGQQAAIAAGLRHSQGEMAVTMDADLQDPPELIPAMIDAVAVHGVDVVYTCRRDRDADGPVKRRLAGAYYRMVRRVAGVPIEPHVGDFRLMTRPVITALNALPERHRVHRLLLPWLGFSSVTLQHTRDRRPAGRTHYSLPRLLRLTADSVVSFTTAPLRWTTFLGLATGAFSLLLTLGAIVARVAGLSIPGWASLAVMVTFIGGVQLICTGILGEYLGRVFVEVQQRPLYDIARVRRPGAANLKQESPSGEGLHGS